MSTASKKSSNAATAHFLFTYKFRKDEQGPVIDRWRTCMQDSGYTIARISKESGVSYGALANWENGTTKRPQYATICAAIRSMGYDFAVVPSSHTTTNGKAWNAAMPPVVKRFRAVDRPAQRLKGVSGAELTAASS
jgi:transcriptional regulator with XRE-family HTH domain